MLKSVQHVEKRLPELVAEQIKGLIAEGTISVGEKLPNEFEMAQELQVGRGTIREAVKILISQNIVEVRRGCGTFVCERTGIIDDPLGLWMIEDKKKLSLDLCEVRMMLEPKIARIAAANATADDIEALKNAAGAVEENIRQNESHRENDILLHEIIAKLSNNEVITKLIPIIQSSVSLFISITDSALKEETIETHRAVVEAIERHDPDGAEEAMIRHLLSNQKLIEQK